MFQESSPVPKHSHIYLQYNTSMSDALFHSTWLHKVLSLVFSDSPILTWLLRNRHCSTAHKRCPPVTVATNCLVLKQKANTAQEYAANSQHCRRAHKHAVRKTLIMDKTSFRDPTLPPRCKWDPRTSETLGSVDWYLQTFRHNLWVTSSRNKEAKKNVDW